MGSWRPTLLAVCCTVSGCRSQTSPAADIPDLDAGRASSSAVPKSPVGLPSASVAAVVNPMNLQPYSGPTGSIEGTVLVRGPEPPDVPNLDVHTCPAALDTYGKLFRAGPRVQSGARALADALVVVTGYSGYLPEKKDVEHVVIGANCGYPSRVIALTFGQRLEIANDSTVPFAPYLEGAPQFTVMVAPPQQRGEPVKIFPVRSDFFPLRDQLQKFVRVDVYVLRQPLHAVTDLRGHFRIDGVPVGRVRVSARLGAVLGETDRDVDVQADSVQNVELSLLYAPSDAATPPPQATKRPSP
jgi:hypothetical protein